MNICIYMCKGNKRHHITMKANTNVFMFLIVLKILQCLSYIITVNCGYRKYVEVTYMTNYYKRKERNTLLCFLCIKWYNII